MRTIAKVAAACGAVWIALAQGPAPTSHILPEAPDDAVVARFAGGAVLTARELRGIHAAMDPQVRAAFDRSPVEWLRRYAGFRRLAEMAVAEKLDRASPVRDAIEHNRVLLLSQFMINVQSNTHPVADADIAKRYAADAARYREVRAGVIYLAFTAETEARARAKAQRLARALRHGADFATLARENSDDAASRAQGGDLGVLRYRDAKLPDAVRAAVFGLAEGATGDPVRHANGYYVFRAAAVRSLPLGEVREEIREELQGERMRRWLDEVKGASGVEVDAGMLGVRVDPSSPRRE